jgi:hypothetical protein
MKAPKVFPDGESTISEDLVREGSEEAEFDTRIHLAENDGSEP